MFNHILVICTGNICRSPVAEAMLRHRLPSHHVESAGLAALVDQGVEPKAKEFAEQAGFNVNMHKARQLTTKMLHDADIILVMTEGQRRAVGNLDPASTGKTMLIGRWIEKGNSKEIPDPYRKSKEAFQHVHKMLDLATSTWVSKLE